MENIKAPEVIDIRQTQEYADYLKKGSWIVERIKNTNYFIKKLPLVGSILKLQRPEKLRYKDIRMISKKYRVFQIIIEPLDTNQESRIKNYGFKLSKSPYLPSKTLQINLRAPISKITANFKKDTRYALRATKNLKLISRACRYAVTNNLNNLGKFREAWKKAVGFKRYVPKLKSLINLYTSFSPNKLIFLTSHNAGAIFIRTKDIAYYWQAFTNKEGRTSLSQYSLVWKGLLWAKRMGCRVFDFEGIYDERFPNKSWLGFTHFKKSFGGKEVNFPGCYTKIILPFRL